jgi:hypothetical protein
MKNIVKKILYLMLMLIALAVGKSITKSIIRGTYQNSKQLTYEDSLLIYLQSLEGAEDSLNNVLSGKKLDEITIVDSLQISKADTSIHYFYHITAYEKNEIDIEEFNKVIKPMLDSSVINNEKMSINRRFKTKFIYSYFDNKGEFITTIKADY